MKKFSLLTPLLCLFLLAVFSFSPAKKAKQAAEHLLTGTWQGIAMNRDGEEEEVDYYLMIEFQEGKVTSKVNGEVIADGEYTLDDSQEPKWLDIKIFEDGELEQQYLCLYRIEENQLFIAQSADDHETQRPTTLEKGKGKDVIILKRPEEKPEAEDIAEDKAAELEPAKPAETE